MQKEKMEIQIGKELEHKGIPSHLAKFIIADDAETANENVKTLESAWKKALDEAVSKKLASPTPKSGGSAVTEEQALKRKIFEAAGIKL
jgi:hypothetical protein